MPTAVPPSASSRKTSIAFSARAFRVSDLLRVTAELLSEADRRRIHQMGAANLDDVPKFLRLSSSAPWSFSRRQQTFFNCSAALM